MSQKLVIVGAGGAGLEALMVARRMTGAWEVLGFADDAPTMEGQTVDGVAVLGATNLVTARFGNGTKIWFHCAVGKNIVRKRLVAMFEEAGFFPATLIDPTAVVAASAEIGAGSYIAPLAFVGPMARVGRHVLVNTGASVGHHTRAGDFAQLCPGGRLSGHTDLGEGAFVGSNAVTVPGIKVGEWSTLGAASLTTRDMPPRVTAIGVPAKILAPPTSNV